MEDATLSMGKHEGIYAVCSSLHPSARKCMIAPSAHAASAYNGQALLLMLYIYMPYVQPWDVRRAERAAGAILGFWPVATRSDWPGVLEVLRESRDRMNSQLGRSQLRHTDSKLQ